MIEEKFEHFLKKNIRVCVEGTLRKIIYSGNLIFYDNDDIIIYNPKFGRTLIGRKNIVYIEEKCEELP
jgi:hypothetical protein